MADAFSAHGKQILRGKSHVADAASPEIAAAITVMLNSAVLLTCDVTDAERALVEEVLWK